MHIYLTSDDSKPLTQLAASLNQDLQVAGLMDTSLGVPRMPSR